MRQMCFVITVLMVSGPAAAQIVEVGGGISRGCIGDSSGFCSDERGPMWAAEASTWFVDRIEVGVRVAVVGLRDWQFSVARDSRFTGARDPAARELPEIHVSVRNRSRRILGGEVLYHFARGRRVRFFLGGGAGDSTDRIEQRCAPAGCDQIMPFVSAPVGRSATHGGNVTIVTGASTTFRERVRVRGGVRFHNFGAEELSTSELFVAAGYRFGAR